MDGWMDGWMDNPSPVYWLDDEAQISCSVCMGMRCGGETMPRPRLKEISLFLVAYTARALLVAINRSNLLAINRHDTLVSGVNRSLSLAAGNKPGRRVG